MPPKRGRHPQAAEEVAAGALRYLQERTTSDREAMKNLLHAMMDQAGEWQSLGFGDGVVSSDLPELAAMSQQAKTINEQRTTPGKRPREQQNALG